MNGQLGLKLAGYGIQKQIQKFIHHPATHILQLWDVGLQNIQILFNPSHNPHPANCGLREHITKS